MIISTRYLITLLFVFNTAWDTPICAQQYVHGKRIPENKSSNNTGWSAPFQIPIEIGERAPHGADIAIGKQGLYMTFQVYTPGVYQPHDVWLITFKNGTWQAPVLIRETSFTADGSKVAVSDRNLDDNIHLVWWDKRSEEPYNAENLFSEDTISEIWHIYKNNGEWSEPLKLFEGNHFTPKLTKPVFGENSASLYFTYYAGVEIANDGIPSLFLAHGKEEEWQTTGPIVTGGGAEASLVQLNSDNIIVVFNAPGFEWIKDNFDSDWRGILLKISKDQGNTWNDPYLIYRKNWEHTVTANPRLIRDPSGQLHLFWRQDTTGDNQPDRLVHTRSIDGLNWSEIELPEIHSTPNSSVLKYDIAVSSEGNIHIVSETWTEDDSFRLMHSIWNGMNWSTNEVLFDGNDMRNPVIAFDNSENQLHLVFQAQDSKVNDQEGVKEWMDFKTIQSDEHRFGYDRLSGWNWYHAVFVE
ncbi:MAG: exo-alpha-sialidase [Balneolaceae bacterium]|nr:MAG: exo-alpha-sialidase [Balneolaceae bacterium]